MRSEEILTLPAAQSAYNQQNEMQMRRFTEQYLATLRNDIVTIRDAADTEGTLAMRRSQFLLMGA